MKSRSAQTLSCILIQEFYWEISHLVWLILLICQQRFLFNVFNVFFIFFHKNAFLTFLFMGRTFFLHLWANAYNYTFPFTAECLSLLNCSFWKPWLFNYMLQLLCPVYMYMYKCISERVSEDLFDLKLVSMGVFRGGYGFKVNSLLLKTLNSRL